MMNEDHIMRNQSSCRAFLIVWFSNSCSSYHESRQRIPEFDGIPAAMRNDAEIIVIGTFFVPPGFPLRACQIGLPAPFCNGILIAPLYGASGRINKKTLMKEVGYVKEGRDRGGGTDKV